MPLPPVGSLLSLWLFTGPLPALMLPECPTTLRVDARATSQELPPVVCLHPGDFTNLHLDAELVAGKEAVVVEGEERLPQVDRITQGVTLYVPEGFPKGARYRVTLRFAGDSAPATVTLDMVVHPSLVTHQVRIHRYERPVGELARDAEEAWAEALHCKEEKARLQAACSAAAGLRALIGGDEPADPRDFKAAELTRFAKPGKNDALSHSRLYAYRLRAAVVLAVKLTNPGAVAWQAVGATLTSSKAERITVVQVVQQAPIVAGGDGWVIVEVALGSEAPEGPLTLTLWNEGGRQPVSLGNLTLP